MGFGFLCSRTIRPNPVRVPQGKLICALPFTVPQALYLHEPQSAPRGSVYIVLPLAHRRGLSIQTYLRRRCFIGTSLSECLMLYTAPKTLSGSYNAFVCNYPLRVYAEEKPCVLPGRFVSHGICRTGEPRRAKARAVGIACHNVAKPI